MPILHGAGIRNFVYAREREVAVASDTSGLMNQEELEQERAYLARVQQIMLSVIENSREIAGEHVSSIKQLLNDAWEELRQKPTALSEQDMQQIAGEVDRYLARKAFNDDVARRYERILMTPYFARVDFQEEGSAVYERIVIGLYSLYGPDSQLLVHDWRAPVCSLYYDSLPGKVSYLSPSGEIRGMMRLKRQYKMEDGKLKYYVNTQVSIEDDLLLDILSGATQHRIRQIVATIQAEQNRAIRYGNEKLLSVVGSAGSGKTSVAMHRIAFLMYRYRDRLEAGRILIVSPSNSFSEYISTVLPELGEENAPTITLYKLVTSIVPGRVEKPLAQTEVLLEKRSKLRRQSVRYKSGLDFKRIIELFAREYSRVGPAFKDIKLDDAVLIRKDELERMYRIDFVEMQPALRLERIRNVIASRLERWEANMYKSYMEQLRPKYRGKDLENASHFAVSHRLQPLRKDVKEMLNISISRLYAQVLKDAPEDIRRCAEENAEAGIVWWEDAPCMAYLMLLLGFARGDRGFRHLVADEAQDYSACALGLLGAYFPEAHFTLLGDPKQRTIPGLPMLDVSMWNECFGLPDAPMLTLSRCYRSTLNITRICNAILPEDVQVVPFGREGAAPEIVDLSDENVLEAVARCKEAGMASIAVVTRTLPQADRLSRVIPRAHLLDGSDEDILNDPGDVAVGSFYLMKGLEFDAVIVAWPYARLTDGERRRLYTACSRALHMLVMCVDRQLVDELGIIV